VFALYPKESSVATFKRCEAIDKLGSLHGKSFSKCARGITPWFFERTTLGFSFRRREQDK
jgi:hypothetical protein